MVEIPHQDSGRRAGSSKGGTPCGNGLQAIFADRVRHTSLTATGNGAAGVFAVKALALEASTVTGNDAGGDGVDLLTGRLPRLTNVTCGRIASLYDATTWRVCALD